MLFQDLLPSMISRCKFSVLFLGHAYLQSHADYIWQKKSLMDADNNLRDGLK